MCTSFVNASVRATDDSLPARAWVVHAIAAMRLSSESTEEDTNAAAEPRSFPAFPHEPYDIQLDFMRALYGTIDGGGIGLFESPTGELLSLRHT